MEATKRDSSRRVSSLDSAVHSERATRQCLESDHRMPGSERMVTCVKRALENGRLAEDVMKKTNKRTYRRCRGLLKYSGLKFELFRLFYESLREPSTDVRLAPVTARVTAKPHEKTHY